MAGRLPTLQDEKKAEDLLASNAQLKMKQLELEVEVHGPILAVECSSKQL